MLIATITTIIILTGGGGAFSFGIFKDAVKTEVSDKDRSKQVVAYLDEGDDGLKAYRKALKRNSKELAKLNAKLDASRGEFDALTARMDAERILAQRTILDVRFKVIELVTEDEWNALYKATDAKVAEQKAAEEKKE